MGNCMNGTKKGHESNLGSSGKKNQATTEVNTQPSNSKPNKSNKENAEKPKYTLDKYGRKVPVLSDIGESNLMLRRNNSKEQIEKE